MLRASQIKKNVKILFLVAIHGCIVIWEQRPLIKGQRALAAAAASCLFYYILRESFTSVSDKKLLAALQHKNS